MPHTFSVNPPHRKDITLQDISTTLAGLPPEEFDKQVRPLREYLEQFNSDGELAKLMLEDNITNHLVDGLYVRELLIPEGSLILSRVHKRALVNIISKGYVIVIDSNGYNEYKAPCTFVSQAGTQRVVIAPEETVWNTAHLTQVQHTDELLNDLTFDNYDEFISYSNKLEHKENI